MPKSQTSRSVSVKISNLLWIYTFSGRLVTPARVSLLLPSLLWLQLPGRQLTTAKLSFKIKFKDSWSFIVIPAHICLWYEIRPQVLVQSHNKEHKSKIKVLKIY